MARTIGQFTALKVDRTKKPGVVRGSRELTAKPSSSFLVAAPLSQEE
jgi:hypothetical protein